MDWDDHGIMETPGEFQDSYYSHSHTSAKGSLIFLFNGEMRGPKMAHLYIAVDMGSLQMLMGGKPLPISFDYLETLKMAAFHRIAEWDGVLVIRKGWVLNTPEVLDTVEFLY